MKMDVSKVVRVGSVVLTVVSGVASVALSFASDYKMNETIDKKVAEAVAKIGK